MHYCFTTLSQILTLADKKNDRSKLLALKKMPNYSKYFKDFKEKIKSNHSAKVMDSLRMKSTLCYHTRSYCMFLKFASVGVG